MTRLAASRFEITLTLIELDDDGEPTNEYPQQAHTLYGLASARRWLDELPARIAEAERQINGGGDTANGHNAELQPSLPGRD